MVHDKNYNFRTHSLNGVLVFDIEQENLLYADASPTHHGLQCNFVGGTPEHDKLTKLCSEAVEIMKKIHNLNGVRPTR